MTDESKESIGGVDVELENGVKPHATDRYLAHPAAAARRPPGLSLSRTQGVETGAVCPRWRGVPSGITSRDRALSRQNSYPIIQIMSARGTTIASDDCGQAPLEPASGPMVKMPWSRVFTVCRGLNDPTAARVRGVGARGLGAPG